MCELKAPQSGSPSLNLPNAIEGGNAAGAAVGPRVGPIQRVNRQRRRWPVWLDAEHDPHRSKTAVALGLRASGAWNTPHPRMKDSTMTPKKLLQARESSHARRRSDGNGSGLVRRRRLALCKGAIERLEDRTMLTTFWVVNTDDNGGVNPAPGDGTGTLRQALIDVNADTGNSAQDTIDFAISAPGVHTIQPGSDLPRVEHPVLIDGYSQGKYSAPNVPINNPTGDARPNTLAVGDNAVLLIELSGNSTLSQGLWIDAGSTVVQGLVVNNFSAAWGIHVGAANDAVQGCFIGTDPSGIHARPNGSLGQNNQGGVELASPSLVGVNGDDANPYAERNIISGNGSTGIDAYGGSVVAGNYIGVDATGERPLGNGLFGVGAHGGALIGTDGNSVADDAERNVISASMTVPGNGSSSGVFVTGQNNHIAGNYIGTDALGSSSMGSQHLGVLVDQSGSNNDIGLDPADHSQHPGDKQNVISGNLDANVEIFSASGNRVDGNYIGLDATGTRAVAGNGVGIHIHEGSQGNVIGTDSDGVNDALERNVISGNGAGVEVRGTQNVVAGNYIGTDSTGTTITDPGPDGLYGTPDDRLLGNGFNANGSGVIISFSATGNTIGGSSAAARNVIAGSAYGIRLFPEGAPANAVSGNVVEGNYIGTDKTGKVALANALGVQILGASSNLIGGTTVAEGNVISGNREFGVNMGAFGGNAETGNSVLGNWIGTDPTGSNGPGLGNGWAGVEIDSGSYNQIGGTAPGQGNTIAYNNPGVVVTGTSLGNSIRDNSIHDNNGLGIDLGGDGVTLNGSHALGTAGPNNWQTFPFIAGVSTAPSSRVAGTLHSTPGTSLTIDFYSSTAPDPSGYGEGQHWIGSTIVNTDNNGDVRDASGNLGFNVPVNAVNLGEWVTATATGPSGTSEFSKAVVKTSHSPTTIQWTASVASPIYGQPETLTATVTPMFPNDGTPGGSVTFSDGGTVLGTVPVSTAGGTVTASLTTASLGVGQRSVSATYSGDTGFSGSSATASLLVQQATAKITLDPAPAVAYFDQSVTLAVTATALGGSTKPPTGEAIVYDETHLVGAASFVPVTGTNTATAAVRVIDVPVGDHTLTVRGLDTSAGDFVFQSCTLPLSILPGQPAITSTVSPSTPTAGLPMTLTATITDPSNGVVPTGTVSFYDGVSLLGTATVATSGTTGTAELDISAPAAGSHRIRTIYHDPYFYSASIPTGELTDLTPGRNTGQNGVDIVAVDGNGTVFTADGSSVYKVGTGGTLTAVASGLNGIFRLAADHKGHLFVSGTDGTITEVNSDGSGTPSIVTTLPAAGPSLQGAFLAVDSSDDLFASFESPDFTGSNINLIYEFKPDGTSSLFAQFSVDVWPLSIAFDPAGNLYGAEPNRSELYRIQSNGTLTLLSGLLPPNSVFLPFNNILNSGSFFRGIAADGAGDILVPGNGSLTVVHPEATFATVLGGFYGSLAAPAVDPQGNIYVSIFGDVRKIDMTPNLTINPLQSSDVQSALTSQNGSITIQVSSSALATNVIQAINGLSSPSGSTETITLDLGGQMVTTETPLSAPTGVDVTFQNGTLVGGSPALVVNSGNVKLNNVTALNSTNAPTILVNGGSLTIRNSTIQESTGFADAAILINSGTVDLGTTSDPGGNVINVSGVGALIQNASGTPITAAGDTFTANGVTLSSTVGGASPAPSSLSGLVFADFNGDGQVDFGETPLAGATVNVDGSDFLGNPVHLTQTTDADGIYVFPSLIPGNYDITSAPPTGYAQGVNTVGTLGGAVSGAQLAINLPASSIAMNYNFGDRPAGSGPVEHGQTAGIGFWNNKKGQALINALNGGVGTQLGDWLAATLPHIFGASAGNNNLYHKSNADVASFFQSLFVATGQRLDAQVLATALAVYVTDATLDNTGVGTQYGFTVSGYGVATATINVGTNGAAFGVADNTVMTVMDALLATDAQAVNGILYNGNTTKRNQANTVFSAINQGGSV